MTFPYFKITSKISRPILPFILKYKEKLIFYSALIDSGADYCIFSIELAQVLGIELSKSKISFMGIGKEKVQGFWGEVEVRIGGVSYKTKVIFAEISEFGHGIFGHTGFFDQFDITLSYQKQTIEIEPYDNIYKSGRN